MARETYRHMYTDLNITMHRFGPRLLHGFVISYVEYEAVRISNVSGGSMIRDHAICLRSPDTRAGYETHLYRRQFEESKDL